MTITQLHYVLAIAEQQNFTVAAEKCFVTQPTMSMQVQKLEEELEVLIFDRSKKPIALTEVGKKIIYQARKIVNEASRIKDVVDQEKGYIGGEFKLGIIPTVMPTLLPMFIKIFIRKYPKVNLKIEELNTFQIIKSMFQQRFYIHGNYSSNSSNFSFCSSSIKAFINSSRFPSIIL